MNKCVHTEHCCAEYGCKYGDDTCPVWLGYKKQSFPTWDGLCGSKEIPEIPEEVFEKRRQEVDDKYRWGNDI